MIRHGIGPLLLPSFSISKFSYFSNSIIYLASCYISFWKGFSIYEFQGDEEDNSGIKSSHCDDPFLLIVVVVSYYEPVINLKDKQHNSNVVVVVDVVSIQKSRYPILDKWNLKIPLWLLRLEGFCLIPPTAEHKIPPFDNLTSWLCFWLGCLVVFTSVNKKKKLSFNIYTTKFKLNKLKFQFIYPYHIFIFLSLRI